MLEPMGKRFGIVLKGFLANLSLAALLAWGPIDLQAAAPLSPEPAWLRKLPEDAHLELHAHLFMNEGMTWLFRGDFEGPLAADSWRDRFSSQANAEALERSGIQILVASLYAHPLFTWNLRDSIRRQIAQAERFVATHPDWLLARDFAQAEEGLKRGKRILLLSLEGADGILETEEDLREFVDQAGIRIVNLLHLMDDEYGGVALLGSFRALSSPFAWLRSLFRPKAGDPPVRVNPRGLTPKGRELAQKLLERKVWLDLAHASDEAQRELLPLLREHGQPVLYTHTVLRKYHAAERALSDEQIEWIKTSQGIVGLMPSPELLEGTPTERDCQGTVQALAIQHRELAARIGETSVSVGSDYNGGIPHLRPSCRSTGTSLDQPPGHYTIGQSGELHRALRESGAPLARPLRGTVGRFMQAWSLFSR